MRVSTFAPRRATATGVAVALVAGVLTLGAAIGLGLRWPSGWLGSGPDDTTDFDYSALGRTLGRLRDGYVNEALAGGVATGGEAAFGSASTRTARRAPVVHAFTNDDFEDAYEVRSLPFTARSNTSGATRQSAEPVDCLPVGGTAWYRYRAPSDAALFADTFGSPAATTLAVFTGDRLGGLSAIGCDTNVLGNAQIGFRATKATTYWFQVTSPRGGPTVFELAAVGPTTVVSVAPSGELADAGSFDRPAISGNGRYVAFGSYARNLAPNPPPCPDAGVCETLYLRDRLTGQTTALATQSGLDRDSWAGIPFFPSFSGDGRYLSFSCCGMPGMGYRSAESEPKGWSVYLYDRLTGQTELVSRNSAGESARSDADALLSAAQSGGNIIIGSFIASVSVDGRFVTFNSNAKNLPEPAERGKLNVYLRDRVLGTTRLVSTDPSGQPNHADNCAGTGRNVSRDGRHVAFMSTYGTGTEAPGYVYLVYLWDALTGRSRLVSKLPPGVKPQTAGNYCVGLSQDGSHVSFFSRDALVPEDTNGTPDAYVYDVAKDRLRRVSVTSAGEQTVDPYIADEKTGGLARGLTLSADGRFAVFDSAAPNLAPAAVGSTRNADSRPPGPRQVYLHDLETGATTLASVSSTGEPLAGESILPYISPDGRTVTFMHVEPSGRLEVMVHELR